MWQEIYNFLERFSGVSYDFNEDLMYISGYKAFIEPYEWHSGITNILDNLEEAIDIIDQFGDELYEDLPNKKALKKLLASYVLSNLIANVNNIKRILNLDDSENICCFDDLERQIDIISELIGLLVENTIDDVLKHDLFKKHEEDEDNDSFADILGINEKDMVNLSFTVTSIRDDYFESLEENDDEE